MSWVFWEILAAVFAAATALLAKVGVAHVDSNLAAALRTSVVVVFTWAVAIALGKHGEIRDLDRRTVFFSNGWVKRRSTFTTSVFSCLSLTTTPCKILFGISLSPWP